MAPIPGLAGSAVFDLPGGALIVWCLAVLAIMMGSMCHFLPENLFEART